MIIISPPPNLIKNLSTTIIILIPFSLNKKPIQKPRKKRGLRFLVRNYVIPNLLRFIGQLKQL